MVRSHGLFFHDPSSARMALVSAILAATSWHGSWHPQDVKEEAETNTWIDWLIVDSEEYLCVIWCIILGGGEGLGRTGARVTRVCWNVRRYDPGTG